MSIWGNSDFLDSIVLIASGIVALYAVWELIFETVEYKKGKAEKPTARKRIEKIVLAILGIAIFTATWRSGVLSKAKDRAIKEQLRLTEQQLIQRSLTQAQEHEIIEALKKSGLRARIPVICPETSEPMALAAQMNRILQQAGWDTEATPGLASPPWQGIILTVENLDGVPASASFLASQLEKYGFPVRVTNRSGAPRIRELSGSKTLRPSTPALDLLNLWVGEKPSL